LDPVGMTEMRELIGRIAADGRTVLVSSHLLSELEQVADWLLIIDGGRLVYADAASRFAERTSPQIVLGAVRQDELLRLAQLVAAQGLHAVREDGHVVVTVDGADPRRTAASLNQTAAAAGIVLSELHLRRPTLESSYLDLLQGAGR
ncbi:MAG: ABC transporter ATP-binding protein, partial [Actinomycetes bacterium]